MKKKENYVQGNLFPELGDAEAKPKPRKSKLEKLAEQNCKLQEENEANLMKIAELQKANELLKRKAEAFDDLMQSKSLFPIGVIAKNFGLSAIALNKYLHEKGVQFCRGEVWTLYAKYQNCGYTQHCWYNYSEDTKGRPLSRAHMYWTAKGMNFIRELLIADGRIEA